MYVALRDLRHARGRFALVATVLVLITFLVTLLASLTAGLARESTSAVTDLPADHLAFGMPAPEDAPEFTASRVTQEQLRSWDDVPGVVAAPLGVVTIRAEAGSSADNGGETASVTVFGVAPDSGLIPGSNEAGDDLAPGGLVLSRTAVEALGARIGDVVHLAGTELTVTGTSDSEASYSHTPVVWSTLADWQRLAGTPDGAPEATVVALRTTDVDADALMAVDEAIGTTTVSTNSAQVAVASYAGENTSLTAIQAFLLAISALVVGAFFAVWTMGRTGDVAVLKALGASTAYLLRDAVGQAALVLTGGVTLGTVVTFLISGVLPDSVPVAVSASTTVLPGLALVVLGLIGATVSVARITRVDPHAALAAR